jgi:hypothetical protein
MRCVPILPSRWSRRLRDTHYGTREMTVRDPEGQTKTPDSTAVRVALWRAMHVQVDQPGHQAWKQQRLIELGFGIPDWLRLVPVDFEASTVVQQRDGGFQGQFTIVNNGSTAINGWQLSAVLPGDHIDTTWNATFQTNGDVLTMNPPSYQTTIPAGTSLQEHFVAQGSTISPAGCTFDGAAC